MSYIIKKVRIDIRTGEEISVEETIEEGSFYRGEDILVRLFAESCLREHQKQVVTK